ncbi:MAG: aldo/keto reductase [Steroidobacteraceae bacterium]
MEQRSLGRSGVRLPSIGFGCMGLVGWYGERNDAEARATVLEALERGVTHFDTAQSYQNGANETFVGELLRTRRRDVFLATKYGITRDPQGALVVDNAPAALRQAVDASLARLGTDWIDLFYLHRIDARVPIEESVGALRELVATGKLRHLGLSECSVATLRRACAVHPIAAVQSEYSLWSRDPEDGMLAACRELGAGFVAYSPLGRGFLAGNFRDAGELPAGDARRGQPRFSGDNVLHNQGLADALRELAARRGCSAPQLALAWVLARDPNIVVIPGMKTRAHLRDNLAAGTLRLDAAALAEIEASFAAIGVRGERHPPAMMAAIER